MAARLRLPPGEKASQLAQALEIERGVHGGLGPWQRVLCAKAPILNPAKQSRESGFCDRASRSKQELKILQPLTAISPTI